MLGFDWANQTSIRYSECIVPIFSGIRIRDLETDQFRWREPNVVSETGLMCDKCRAGQMVEYVRTFVNGGKEAKILGTKCDRCGYTKLDSDDDIWSIVGL
ncbi:MAG: hypothetical protein ACHQ1H_12025 [Nitrososphaerales archaeon]